MASVLRHLKIFTIVWLSCILACALSFDAFGIPTQVRVVSEHTLDRLTPPELQDALKKIQGLGRGGLMNLQHIQELRDFVPNLQTLVSSLLRPEDGTRTIQVVVTDDPTPNAFTLDLSNGDRVVSVSAGLLRFIESDDELAFVIGHEMEHPHASIGEYVDELRYQNDSGNTIATLMARSEESEVDIRSVVRRVMHSGRNPYASFDFQDRMTSFFGDRLSVTHNLDSTRTNTRALALTYVRKEQGAKILRPGNYTRDILAPVQDHFFRTPQYENFVRAQLQSLLHFDRSPIKKIYDAIRDDKLHLSYDETSLHYRIWREIFHGSKALLNGTSGIFSGEDQARFHLDTEIVLDEAFEEARLSALGPDFEPRSIGQFDGIQAIDSSRGFSLLNELSLDEEGIERSIKSAQEYLEKLNAGQIPDEAERAMLRRRYENEIPRLQQRARLLQEQIRTAQATLTPLKKRNARHSNPSTRIIEKLVLQAPHKASGSTLERLGESIRRQGPTRSEEFLESLLRNANQDFSAAMQRLSGFENSRNLVYDRPKHVSNILTLIDRISPNEYYSAQSSASRSRRTAINEFLENAFSYGLIKDVQVHEAQPLQLRGNTLFVPSSLWSSDYLARALDSNAVRSEHMEKVPETIRSSAQRALARLKEYRKLPGSDAPALRRRIDAAVAQSFGRASQSYRNYLRTRNQANIPREELEAYVLYQFPEFNETLPAHLHMAPDLILSRIARLFARPGIAETLKSYNSDITLQNIVPLIRGQAEIPAAALYELRNAIKFQEIISYDHARGQRSNPTTEQTQDDLRLRQAILKYVLEHHPHDSPFIAALAKPYWGNKTETIFSEVASELQNQATKFLQDILLHVGTTTLADFSQTANWEHRGRELIKAVSKNLETESRWSPEPTRAELVMNALLSLAPVEPANQVQFMKGLRKSSHEIDIANGSYENAYVLGPIEQMITDGIESRINAQLATDSFQGMALPEKIFWVTSALDLGLKGKNVDASFEQVWRQSEIDPTLRRPLQRPELVRTLLFEENRMRLAHWQLEQEFGISRQKPSAIRVDHERTETKQIHEWLVRQFPQRSPTRDQLIHWIEGAFVTSPVETRKLSALRINQTNWSRDHRLILLDVPQVLAARMEIPLDRLEMAFYMTGASRQLPAYFSTARSTLRRESPETLRSNLQQLESSRRAFSDSAPELRTYALQSLLNQSNGILSDPTTLNRLVDHLLGSQASDPVFRSLFMAYYDSLPPTDRGPVIGHLLSQPQATDSVGSINISNILASMGPFGVKVAQFLSSSGAVAPEVREQLLHFLDRAAPPNRLQVTERLQNIFHENLLRVGRIVGSGSVNVVVETYLKDPISGQERRAAVRLLRENVEGRVANEAAIWSDVIARLQNDNGPQAGKIHLLAHVLSEARTHVLETLGPGGSELDLSIARGIATEAAKVYTHGPSGPHGLRTRALIHDENLQSLVSPEHAGETSVYEFVAATRIGELPPALRRDAAQRILRTELQALFEEGVFDPEPHFGNWLIDPARKQLVRIDYDQLRQLSPTERDAVRETFRTLVSPLPRAEGLARTLDSDFGRLFHASGISDNQPFTETELLSILTRTFAHQDFPNASHPHERLFFLRTEIERALREKTGDPNIHVDLHDNLRSALNSFSRLVSYAEHLGPEFGNFRLGGIAFIHEVITALNIPRSEYLVRYAQTQVPRLLERLPISKAACAVRALAHSLKP